MPRLGVIQAEGSSPFYEYMSEGAKSFRPQTHPETLATAIKIGDPVSWPKAAVVQKQSGPQLIIRRD